MSGQVSVTPLDEAVAEARREALELVAEMSRAMAIALDALEQIAEPGAEDGSPVEWPLPAKLVLERQQLAAFVTTMEDVPAEQRAAIRATYARKLEAVKQPGSADLSTFELSTAPVLPETKRAREG
jgi:hypothetical protein